MSTSKPSHAQSYNQNDIDGLGKLFNFAKDLTELSYFRSMIEIFLTWIFLVFIIGSYLYIPHPVIYCFVLPIVASRQYALMILMHDGFHSLLHPNRKINHAISMFLLAYPCGSAYWIARKSHLAHHRFLGTNEDPDRDLYISKGKESFVKILSFFIMLPLGEQVKRTYGISDTPTVNTSAKDTLFTQYLNKLSYLSPVAIYQCVIVGLFYQLGSVTSYITLWLLPLLIATLFNGIRIFCEHGNITDTPGDKAHRTITYFSNPIERFFIAPFHMNYHAEHHLFPYVPHYNLHTLRKKIIANTNLRQTIQWRQSYFQFLITFLSQTSTPGSVIDEHEYKKANSRM